MGEGATGGVGLVLGAGGVAGHAWHAGVLAALDEALGWDGRRAEVVVGTSAGAAVAAILRAGMAPADVFARATGAPLSAEATELVAAAGMATPYAAPPYQRPPARRLVPASAGAALRALAPWDPRPGLLAAGGLPRGTTETGPLAEGIGRLHPDGWPARALWLCAVRLRDGKLVVFGRDAGTEQVPVGRAVAASCAIPGWFAPVAIGGEDHVDGGAHSPTNADLLVGRRPDLVVISSPMSLDRAAARRPRPERALRVAHRARLRREVAALRRTGATVVSFQPGEADLAVIGRPTDAMAPERRAPIARQARDTTLRRLERSEVREALGGVGG